MQSRLLHGIIALCMIMFPGGCTLVCRQPGSGVISAGEIQAFVVPVPAHPGAVPLKHSVRPGTLVIWVNQSGNDIRIVLPDQRVVIACLSPVNFDVSAEGLFTSARLPPGAVASLCFVQPGSYGYSIERWPGAGSSPLENSTAQGSIIVR